MTKKLLALLLALTLVLAFAACDRDVEAPRHEQKETTPTQTADASEPEPETTSAPRDRKAGYKSPYTEFEQLDDTVIIDDDFVTVTLGKPALGDFAVEYEVRVQNKCDHEVGVYAEYIAINGQMVPDGFGVIADAKDSDADTAWLTTVTDPAELTRFTLAVHVYDTDTYKYDQLHYIDIYPQGKAAYKQIEAPVEKQVLIDEDGVYASIVEYYTDEDGYFRFSYVTGNYTDQLTRTKPIITAVNGFGYYSTTYTSVLPDTYAIDTNYVEMHHMKALGIEKVQSLSLECIIEDMDYDTLIAKERILYPEADNAAAPFEFVFEDDPAVSEDGFSLGMVKTIQDEYGTQVFFVIKNDTGKKLTVLGENLEINGKALEYTYLVIEAGRPIDAYGVVSVSGDDLNALEIEQVESVKMDLKITDESGDTLFNDTVTFKF